MDNKLNVPRISVVAVVHNEAEYIERSFEALWNYVDDFVVIDQESTDNTVALAKSFTDKVYLFPRVYYPFAYIHEACLMANHDWCLKCDPDETWDKSLLEQFSLWANSDYDIINFNVMGIDDKKKDIPPTHPRLFRKSKVIWTDSLNASPYNKENLLEFGVGNDVGVIRNARTHKESIESYRIEAAKRLLARYGDTKVGVYKDLVCLYKEILANEGKY